jgi:hypothetical protein
MLDRRNKLTSPRADFLSTGAWAWMEKDSEFSSSGRWSKNAEQTTGPLGQQPMIPG